MAAWSALAGSYTMPPKDINIIGQLQWTTASHEDTLLDIARRNGVGQDAITLANPGVDRWLPGEGTGILLPTRHILPDAPRKGLVINLPEMRMYSFEPGNGRNGAGLVATYPVSIGRMDWATPLGSTKVVSKVKNPAWYPPASIRKEARERGESLPSVVPPGPDNPLGNHAMRLDIPGYLIHGTNRPDGVGMRVTHGCVRMYPEDIEGLFSKVPNGTAVRFVNQPYKAAWLADTLFFEAHPALDEDEFRIHEAVEEALRVISEASDGHMPPELDMDRLLRLIQNPTGMPVALIGPQQSI
jgi:L,D-transpeptidase ErfK/SrfK